MPLMPASGGGIGSHEALLPRAMVIEEVVAHSAGCNCCDICKEGEETDLAQGSENVRGEVGGDSVGSCETCRHLRRSDFHTSTSR